MYIIKNMTDDEIWGIIRSHDGQNIDLFDNDEKTFITHVYKNDLTFVKNKNNYDKIYNKDTRIFCFLIACMYCDDPCILSFILDVFLIKINQLEENTFLMSACANNHNLEIIKFLCQHPDIDVFSMDKYKQNSLHKACTKNTNLSIIKYLVEDKNMDVNLTDTNGDNCLTLSCWKNPNPMIIKYLIEEKNMNIDHRDKEGHDCLLSACWLNNISVVKYLIEQQKIDPRTCSLRGLTCINRACLNDSNLDVLIYLINNTSVSFNSEYIKLRTFQQILPSITDNFYRFNEFIQEVIKRQGLNNLLPSMRLINPLMFNKNNFDLVNFMTPDPWSDTFNIFCIHVV